MNLLRQIAVVTLVFLRSIPQRLEASLIAAIGVALVVAVTVAVFSILEGFQATMGKTGSVDTVLVMRSGTDSELSSGLTLEETRIIADGPGLLRAESGPVASAELFVIVDLLKRVTGTKANVPLRGVQPAAFEVRQDLQIIDGRRFEPGRNEIIAGKGALEQFRGIEVGNTLRLGGQDWKVVGIFTADGSLSESELWCDVKVLQPAYRRGSTFQSVHARLASAGSFDEYRDYLTTDDRLRVSVRREADYYASQSEFLSILIVGLGGPVAFMMGLGAVFGAIITMYTSVAARTREIATLRALGFGGSPVVIAVLMESLFVALVGGVCGGIIAYLGFNGYQASTLNWESFSQIVFAFRVTPRLLAAGLGAALLMGLLGGVLPAIRAARIPVATALREL